MPDTPTPGETAYVVYRSVVLQADWRVVAPAWVDLPALHKAAWEAAAQAVLRQGAQRWTADAIVHQINAREAASLEALRREAEDPDHA